MSPRKNVGGEKKRKESKAFREGRDDRQWENQVLIHGSQEREGVAEGQHAKNRRPQSTGSGLDVVPS